LATVGVAAAGHCVTAQPVLAAPAGRLDATTHALLAATSHQQIQPRTAISFGQAFASPPASVRPRIRVWVPGAAMSQAGLREEIAGFARQGLGGVELVAMEKRTNLPPSMRWGTANWDSLVAVARAETARHGMSLSLTNGPAWPIAMPAVASADDPASLFELTYGVATIAAGASYDGALPPRRVRHPEGTPKLLAVLAYRNVDARRLDPGSCIDLTSKVSRGANVDAARVTFQPPTTGDAWTLFAFWEQPADEKVGPFYVIDHLSARGGAASVAYWDQALRKPGAPHLGDIFNDSMEYKVAFDWTRGMREIFRAQHGYDLVPYLPFVGVATTYPKGDIPDYGSADPRGAERVRRDYLDTLTALYISNHLAPLQRMAERHGATIRYQAAYNKPLFTETAAAAVGVPETETLGRSALDGMRQMAAAVHLLGKSRFSIEVAAEFTSAYGQTLRDLLWWNKRAWAAGVDSQVLHGASYSGAYDGPGSVDGALPGIKWPGFEGFMGLVSNNWNRLAAPNALRSVADYMARTNLVLSKPAKVDVAVYRDGLDIFVDPSRSPGDGQALYPDGGLLNARGYSYDLVSPALLALPQATVKGGRLAASGPSYKALVVPFQRAMSLDTLRRISGMAQSGLPVVFVGDLPSEVGSHAAEVRGERDADVARAAADLLRLKTVARVNQYADVPDVLLRFNVRPDAEPVAAVDILTQHRRDLDGDFYYLYNYNKVSGADVVATLKPSPDGTSYPGLDPKRQVPRAATFRLAGTGRPYRLDAWSGAVTPLAYAPDGRGAVKVEVSLAEDEAVLIALLDSRQAAAAGARARPGARPSPEAAKAMTRTPLRDWRLTIDAVSAPESGPPLFSRSSHTTLGPFEIGAQIGPWPEVSPSLKRVSGVGDYTTRFSLPAGARGFLDLGRVENGVAVFVNGVEIRGVDQTGGLVDLGGFAHAGENTLQVRAASTLEAVVSGRRTMPAPFGRDGEVAILSGR
jgi:hypothetical protein